MKKRLSFGHINQCQICSYDKLETVLSLGHQPIVQNYLTTNQLHEPETTYPLNFCRCPKCDLFQLDYIINPNLVFPQKYPYRTGLTNMLIKNFRSLADKLEQKYNLTDSDLIIDIGSNDGTLLKGFKEKGMRILGIEPTNAAKDANKSGIPTIQKFFNQKTVQKILKKHGPARIITATNVFAHINDVPALTKNIKKLLSNNGIFVSESQYLMDIFEKLEFDTIYHEHLRFYSLKSLSALFSSQGCSLVDAERISAAGGSIRVYAMRGKHSPSTNVKKLIAAEEAAGLYNVKAWQIFSQKAIEAKNDLLALLIKQKKASRKIVGFTSSARSNTLLGFAKINKHLIDYAVEKKDSPKIGLFTPGTHIPVIDEKKLFEDQPEYVLILSWHIGKELIKLMKKFGYKGKFIMPLPTPRIIDNI